jgi:hypothetical protein
MTVKSQKAADAISRCKPLHMPYTVSVQEEKDYGDMKDLLEDLKMDRVVILRSPRKTSLEETVPRTSASLLTSPPPQRGGPGKR